MKTYEEFKKAMETEEMQQELKEYLETADAETSEEIFACLAAFAKERGYEVDESRIAVDSMAMEEAELAGVSGGREPDRSFFIDVDYVRADHGPMTRYAEPVYYDCPDEIIAKPSRRIRDELDRIRAETGARLVLRMR